MLTSPTKLSCKRMGLLLKSKITWAKNTCLGVWMRSGVACSGSRAQKELILEGNNIELASNSAAWIQQATLLKKRVSENLGMLSMSPKKEQCSRLMSKIYVAQLKKPKRCQMIPKTCSWYFKAVTKALY